MIASIERMLTSLVVLTALIASTTTGFTIPASNTVVVPKAQQHVIASNTVLHAWGGNGRFSDERRQKLGINEDDDEYDLDLALENNTDPLISKIVAGSFIVTMIGLLVVGLIIPYTTDYGEGVCNPILTSGRC